MNELPDKIVRYDTLRVEHGIKKMCKCRDPHFLVDQNNRLVYCLDCGAVVDPFYAMEMIAMDDRRREDYLQKQLEQRKQIDNYKPRRVVIKELERLYNSTERKGLFPTCPHCRHSFELEKLLTVDWRRKTLAEMREDDERKQE